MAKNKKMGSAEDIKVLHSMGYAQELDRKMSGFSNFAISFSIICILAGGINSIAQATSGVGGGAIGIGWIIGCLVSGLFALGMAQISSSYPTAGGLYHWGSILGNRFVGWLTAWFNLIGLVAVLGSVDVGLWYFFSGAFGEKLGLTDNFLGMFGQVTLLGADANVLNLVVFVLGALIIQGIINHIGIRLTSFLTDISGYIIFATAAFLTVMCLVYAQGYDISRLWTFANNSGDAGGGVWPETSNMWLLFGVGLLLPIYTITGYDASAHTSEETHDASTSVPNGILRSVLWSSIAGYVMLVAFLLFIPSMDDAAKQGWGVFFWAINTMPAWASFLIYLGITLAQFLCGLAAMTSTSRMVFAFSRDGGLPLSNVWRKVSTSFRVPANAIWLVVLLAAILTSYASIYSVVVAVCVIFVFISYAIPVIAGYFAIGTSKWNKMGPWNMGKANYKIVAALVFVAMLLVFFLGVQAPNELALSISIGVFIITAIVWFLIENKRFKGPPIGAAISKRMAAIKQAESKFKN
ncbi:MAG: amino acid permease [Hydrotalea sp.]|nr:amino acid permease [Hydrotalea sp.]